MRARMISGGFLALLLTVGCQRAKPPQSEPIAATRPEVTPFSLAEKLAKEKLVSSKNPYLLPSEIAATLARLPARAAEWRQFLKQLLTPVIQSGLPVLDTVLKSSLGIEMTEAERRLLATAAGRVQLVENLANRIATQLGSRETWKRLDDFPTIPIEAIPPTQLFVANLAHPIDERKESSAFPVTLPTDFAAVIKKDGCALPEWLQTQVGTRLPVFSGMEPVKDLTVPCYAENSKIFARLINELSNRQDAKQEFSTISFSVDDTPVKNQPVTRFRDLLGSLEKAGFTVEVFNTRVFVDFLGYWWKDETGTKALRIATQFRVQGKNETFNVPGEHGEVNLMIRKGEERYAQLRWYFGLPDSSVPGVSTYWRPHLYLQTPWAEPIHEVVRVYEPNRLGDVLPWLENAARLMRTFHTMQSRYPAPFNSYGMFVCTDSMTLLVLAMEESLGFKSDSRLTNAFPLIREQKLFLHRLGREVDFERIVSELSGINPTRLSEGYAPDPELHRQGKLVPRVVRAFPPSLDERLGPFQTFKNEDLPRLRGPSVR